MVGMHIGSVNIAFVFQFGLTVSFTQSGNNYAFSYRVDIRQKRAVVKYKKALLLDSAFDSYASIKLFW